MRNDAMTDPAGSEEPDLYADCSGHAIMGHVTSRWGTMTLIFLSSDDMRFSELRKALTGISEKVLSQTLFALRRDGFVWRQADESIPPKVTYGLTEAGREMAVLLSELVAWLGANAEAIAEHQCRFDASEPEASRTKG